MIQAALNQGDYWLTGQVTALVAAKTLISPLVGFGVAYLAAVTTHHDSNRLPDQPHIACEPVSTS
jgi:hypothetical protein